jgi:hypothetical protein
MRPSEPFPVLPRIKAQLKASNLFMITVSSLLARAKVSHFEFFLPQPECNGHEQEFAFLR